MEAVSAALAQRKQALEKALKVVEGEVPKKSSAKTMEDYFNEANNELRRLSEAFKWTPPTQGAVNTGTKLHDVITKYPVQEIETKKNLIVTALRFIYGKAGEFIQVQLKLDKENIDNAFLLDLMALAGLNQKKPDGESYFATVFNGQPPNEDDLVTWKTWATGNLATLIDAERDNEKISPILVNLLTQDTEIVENMHQNKMFADSEVEALTLWGQFYDSMVDTTDNRFNMAAPNKKNLDTEKLDLIQTSVQNAQATKDLLDEAVGNVLIYVRLNNTTLYNDKEEKVYSQSVYQGQGNNSNRLYGVPNDTDCAENKIIRDVQPDGSVDLKIGGRDAKADMYGPYGNIYEPNNQGGQTTTINNNMMYNGYERTFVKGQSEKVEGMNKLFERIYQKNKTLVLFGYGFSGAGKSYTLFGDEKKDTIEEQGTSIGLPFQFFKEKAKEVTFEVTVEEVAPKVGSIWVSTASPAVDSLAERFNDSNVESKGIVESKEDEKCLASMQGDIIHPLGNQTITCTSVEEVYAKYKEVNKIRVEAQRVAPTPNNSASSRSHLFFSVKMIKNKGTCTITISDLAGAEDPIVLANKWLPPELLQNEAFKECKANKANSKAEANDSTKMRDMFSECYFPDPNAGVWDWRTNLYKLQTTDFVGSVDNVEGLTNEVQPGGKGNGAAVATLQKNLHIIINAIRKARGNDDKDDFTGHTAESITRRILEGFWINESLAHLLVFLRKCDKSHPLDTYDPSKGVAGLSARDYFHPDYDPQSQDPPTIGPVAEEVKTALQRVFRRKFIKGGGMIDKRLSGLSLGFENDPNDLRPICELTGSSTPSQADSFLALSGDDVFYQAQDDLFSVDVFTLEEELSNEELQWLKVNNYKTSKQSYAHFMSWKPEEKTSVPPTNSPNVQGDYTELLQTLHKAEADNYKIWKSNKLAEEQEGSPAKVSVKDDPNERIGESAVTLTFTYKVDTKLPQKVLKDFTSGENVALIKDDNDNETRYVRHRDKVYRLLYNIEGKDFEVMKKVEEYAEKHAELAGWFKSVSSAPTWTVKKKAFIDLLSKYSKKPTQHGYLHYQCAQKAYSDQALLSRPYGGGVLAGGNRFYNASRFPYRISVGPASVKMVVLRQPYRPALMYVNPVIDEQPAMWNLSLKRDINRIERAFKMAKARALEDELLDLFKANFIDETHEYATKVGNMTERDIFYKCLPPSLQKRDADIIAAYDERKKDLDYKTRVEPCLRNLPWKDDENKGIVGIERWFDPKCSYDTCMKELIAPTDWTSKLTITSDMEKYLKELAKQVALAITEGDGMEITEDHVKRVILAGKDKNEDKKDPRYGWRKVNDTTMTGYRPLEELKNLQKRPSTTSLWYSLPYGALVQAFDVNRFREQPKRTFQPKKTAEGNALKKEEIYVYPVQYIDHHRWLKTFKGQYNASVQKDFDHIMESWARNSSAAIARKLNIIVENQRKIFSDALESVTGQVKTLRNNLPVKDKAKKKEDQIQMIKQLEKVMAVDPKDGSTDGIICMVNCVRTDFGTYEGDRSVFKSICIGSRSTLAYSDSLNPTSSRNLQEDNKANFFLRHMRGQTKADFMSPLRKKVEPKE